MVLKRKVQFKDKAEICPVLDRHEYTAEEKASTWMTSKELISIRKYVRYTVILLLKGDKRAHPNSESLCTRGLESFTPDGMVSKKCVRYESRRVVLDEQHQQQFELDKCIHNPYRISKEYMSATESSRIKARVIGILDAENVWSDDISLPAFPIAPPTFEMARSEVFITRNNTSSNVTDIEGTRKRRSLVQSQ
jgi:hypothetical protein